MLSAENMISVVASVIIMQLVIRIYVIETLWVQGKSEASVW